MGARNRNSYSKSGGRRSGGTTALAQGSFILFLIAFSFLMGFFVLSRFMPANRGLESQSPGVSAGNDRGTFSGANSRQTVTVRSHKVAAAPRSQPAPQRIPAETPGPSIEPADDEKTQKPSSIDEPSDNTSKEDHKEDQASIDTGDTKASEASATQDPNAIVSIEPGQSPTDTPPRRQRRRRRRTPSAENKSNTDQKSAKEGKERKESKEEPTQAPAKLDDSSDADTKGDN